MYKNNFFIICCCENSTVTWMKLEYSLTPYTKISSQWIKDLKVSLGIIKLLEKSIGRTLFDIYHRNNFLDPPPRVMKIKKKKKKTWT